MLLGVPAILDGEPRAAVQASQTQCAFLLAPDRLVIPHLNSLDRTFLRAQSAADAVLLHTKTLCSSHLSIVKRLCKPLCEKRRCARRHTPVRMALADFTSRLVNFGFCRPGKRCRLFRRGEVKDRCPRVHDPHGVERVDGSAPNRFPCYRVGCSRRCAVGREKAEIVRMEFRFLKKLLHDAWKAPKVCRGNYADQVIRKGIFAALGAVNDGDCFLPQGGCESGGNIFAITRCGKI